MVDYGLVLDIVIVDLMLMFMMLDVVMVDSGVDVFMYVFEVVRLNVCCSECVRIL